MAKVTDVTPGLPRSFALDTVSLKLDLKKESAILGGPCDEKLVEATRKF